MSNSAIIKGTKSNVGVYLHWNGGRDSVEAFLKYCELKQYAPFESDCGMARFIQVVGNYFGGSNSLYVCFDCTRNDADNGVYIVQGWEIKSRQDFEGTEQREYNLKEMLLDIDKSQPKKERIKGLIVGKKINVNDVKIGDNVFMLNNIDNTIETFEVVGIGENKTVNGTNVLNKPYVNKYCNDGSYSNNINNYLLDKIITLKTEKGDNNNEN